MPALIPSGRVWRINRWAADAPSDGPSQAVVTWWMAEAKYSTFLVFTPAILQLSEDAGGREEAAGVGGLAGCSREAGVLARWQAGCAGPAAPPRPPALCLSSTHHQIPLT